MRVTASVPAGGTINIQFIYYQTSDREDLVGGAKENSNVETAVKYGAGDLAEAKAPVFEDDEVYDEENNADPDALVVGAGSDGDQVEQNLWLKETNDFTGVYEGYLRLTDANGAGLCDHDGNADTDPERCNWGLNVRNATGAGDDGAAYLGVESGPVTIRYKNSNGDSRTATILIDKAPPAIQIDSPAHNTSSKDDSPDILGSFSDGGGSNLRGNSFRVYADNTDDSNDDNPIWNFRVNGGDGAPTDNPYGYVCVDANEDKADDATTGCETNGVAALPGHYAGYDTDSDDDTFGIIPSMAVYHDTETDSDDDDARDYKAQNAEDYEDGDASGIFDTVIRIDFPPPQGTENRYNNTIDIQAVVLDIAGNFGFSDSQASDPTFIHDFGTGTKDRDKPGVHNVLGWYSRHQYRLDDVDPEYMAKESVTGFFTDETGMKTDRPPA